MKLIPIALVTGILALPLTAAPVQTGVWYHVTGDPGALGNGLSYTGNAGTPVLDPDSPPWTFTAAGIVTLTVVDLCFDTEQFEVFDFGVSSGITSAPGGAFAAGCQTPTPFTDDPAFTLDNPSFSRGIYLLEAGPHSITISNIAATPTSAAFRVAAAVPEPSTWLLLSGACVLFIGPLRARHRASQKFAHNGPRPAAPEMVELLR